MSTRTVAGRGPQPNAGLPSRHWLQATAGWLAALLLLAVAALPARAEPVRAL
ncbi:MAG: hypothetical protein ACT6T0_13225 [Nevskia sp.]|uniref:hypothetical protein n=1 Tax=Nevskia sp. TaxID=1929292 RepID=UPI00403511D2